jgi:hypothetical protein
MERYKPKIYLPQPNDLPTNILFLGMNSVMNLALSVFGGNQKWICRNAKCNANIDFHISQIPFVCKKCGKAIDWDGIFTSRSKMCPECHKPYDKYDNFCTNHYNRSVDLTEVEKWLYPWIGSWQILPG